MRPATVAVLAGLVLVAASGVHLVRYPATVDTTGAPAGDVGPGPDVDLEDHITGRHATLAALPEVPIRAVVSFRDLVAITALPLPADAEVERLQVLLPGDPTPRELSADEAVDVTTTWIEAGRDRFDREIAELESLLAEDVGHPEFEREFTAEVERLRAARDRPVEQVEVVFAAVVVAPAPALLALVDDRDVLLVDPAGPAAETGEVRLRGVPPTDAAGSPRAVP